MAAYGITNAFRPMRSRLLRALGLTLLLLAVSPATEPFATFDLADLFGDPGTPAAASIQTKTGGDAPVAHIGPAADPRIPAACGTSGAIFHSALPRTSPDSHVQLRI
jgi:hypothetical protein